MKRKLAWLTLPFMLGALIFEVKWVAEHPTPTEQDADYRSLLSESYKADVVEYQSIQRAPVYRGAISQIELEPFINSFHLTPPTSKASSFSTGVEGMITIRYVFKLPREDGMTSMYVNIRSSSNYCHIVAIQPGLVPRSTRHNLHPATVKRWMELLLNHPRIGPKLRARMKP